MPEMNVNNLGAKVKRYLLNAIDKSVLSPLNKGEETAQTAMLKEARAALTGLCAIDTPVTVILAGFILPDCTQTRTIRLVCHPDGSVYVGVADSVEDRPPT